jgi:hypothetical protein
VLAEGEDDRLGDAGPLAAVEAIGDDFPSAQRVFVTGGKEIGGSVVAAAR